MISRIYIALLLLLLSTKATGQYIPYIQYTVRDGLPTNYIYSVIEDKDGYIWAYTEGGISKFDGYRWRTFTVKDGLSGNDVVMAALDKYNHIWLQIYHKPGVAIIKDQVHIPPDSCKYLRISSFIDELYFNYSYDYYSPTLEGNLKHVYQQGKPTLNSKYFRFVAPGFAITDSLGLFKFQYRNKTMQIDEPVGVNYPMNVSSFPINKDTCIFFYGDGKFRIFNIQKQSLSSIDLDKLFLASGEKAPLKQIQITRNLNNEVLLQCERGLGLLVSEDSVRELLNYKAINLNAWYLNGFKDSKGNYWIGTRDAGLIFIPAAFQKTIIYSNGKLNSNVIKGVYFDDATKQVIGVTNSNEVVYIENGHLKKHSEIPQNSTLKSTTKHHGLIVTHFGEKYFISIGKNAAIQLKKVVFPRTNFGRPKKNKEYLNQVSVIQPFSNKSIWLGLSYGFACATPKYVQHKSIFDTISVRFFIERDDGEAIIGTEKGLVLADCALENVQHIETPFKDLSAGIRVSEDELIIGTKLEGLFYYKISDGTSYNISELVNITEIHDCEHRILAASYQGVAVLEKTENKWRVKYILDEKYGLPSNECHSLDSHHDVVYIGTGKGIVQVDLAAIERFKTAAPMPFFTAWSMKNKGLAINNADKLSLGYKQNDLTFEYSLVHYESNKNIQYHLQLSPVQDSVISTSETHIAYYDLNPGDYTLHLTTTDAYGATSQAMPLHFTILPPWWKTKWFYASILCTVLLSFFLFYRWRQRQQKIKLDREHELTQRLNAVKLSALRAQMNPHFMFNALGAIQYYIQSHNTDAADKFLTQFAHLMRKYLECSKNNLIPFTEEIDLLRNYTELEAMRFDNRFAVKVEIDPQINEEDVEIPSMIIQPFLENAINHGLANRKDLKGELKVCFLIEKADLVVQIIDNGIGIENAKKLKFSGHKSRGMEIIHEKLETMRQAGISEFSIDYTNTQPHDPIYPGTTATIRFVNLLDDGN